ncbi:hypothetical protein C900_00650 [Fulvivirga imtechensis AK7]|uniref:Transposase IS200-like domain-containing protein n=1 Tax=Fulvivirga imtechensis AK7 TaxID=1237149 RepID=L8JVY7_9BACT|nr:transposase [Fulvivirga imtechensis]ELR72965.1 hypothetical protein C900_00650 [Fulvivirga imtechensis AK7]
MPQSTTPLLPQTTYHIYTHANGSENLFREDENYYHFLRKYSEYIHPVAETFAYCLMPNHIHLMVRMRNVEELLKFFRLKKPNLQGFENLGGLISQQFSNFLNGYTKAYNKRYDRKGSLFMSNFNRKPIEKASYFTALIAYIHNNPVHHGFVKDAGEWPHSSYHSYLLDKRTKIAREEGLEWFGGREEFIKVHQELKKKDVMLEL